MKYITYAIGFILLFILILAIGLGTSWFGLVTERPMAQYQKETDRLVYQNSVARQQGANNGIGQDCANMEGATGVDAKAYARFVLTDAAAYSGDRGLSSDSLHCVAEAHALINTQ